jgi:hypothetical protein
MQTATRASSAAASLPATGPGSAGEPSVANISFAELLAAEAAPPSREAPWNDEGLAEDVATISYERALRTHSRVRPASSGAEPAPEALLTLDEAAAGSSAESEAAAGNKPLPAAPLKKASITIRLSEPECEQLRQRAAEAGLSVSAYLRSCTLEVESLRAEVKQTLAELRKPAPKPLEHPVRTKSARGIRGAFAGLWIWLRLIGRRRQLALRLNPANPFAPVRY